MPGLHRVRAIQHPLLPGCDLDRPDLCARAARQRRQRRLLRVDDLLAVRREVGAVARVGHAAHGFAERSHDEDAASVLARTKGDQRAVRGEHRIEPVVLRGIRREVDGLVAADALDEDVSVRGNGLYIGDGLAVGREGGRPLDAGIEESRSKSRVGAGADLRPDRPARNPAASRTAAAAKRRARRLTTRDGATPGATAARVAESDVRLSRAKARSPADWKRCSGALLEAAAHDALDVRRDGLVREREVRGLFAEDRRDDVGAGIAAERLPSREHLVEHRAEGEEIAARVGRFAAHLLGCHVTHGSEDHARLRAARRGGEVRALPRARVLGELRETEVENLDAPVLRDEEVLGLEIAVDDALVVRGGKAAGDLDRPVHGAAKRELAGGLIACRSVSPSSSSMTRMWRAEEADEEGISSNE